ncbi:hypothetical protein KC19_10G134500 [Ceratodon purpureus]|uniref:Protein kinase domain-containing protein n=1 Tax=Ceratodon purpureus TaxID=3225 RepID=A0A8T0GMW8_CERPU|nr:hypothetical protein KC19_10G134500 [Ceratodon purpureus]
METSTVTAKDSFQDTDTNVSEMCSDFLTVGQVSSSSEKSALHPKRANSTSTYATQYYSARIQWMIQNREKYSNQVEFDIKCSRIHRTSVQRPGGRRAEKETATLEDVDSSCSSGDESEDQEEDEKGELDDKVLEANREAMEDQKKHLIWGWFFQDDRDRLYEIGKKIGQGGEAKIYAGIRVDMPEHDRRRHVVFKVFPPGYYLRELVKLWTHGVFKDSFDRYYAGINRIVHVMLLPNDGRIAMVMPRAWGDLRRLIDMKKQANHNQGPPFNFKIVLYVMNGIAHQMRLLHLDNVVHRDLKASNILVNASNQHVFISGSESADILPNVEEGSVVVSDFECALGVLGTGFWRAPEVLLGIRDPIQKLSTTLFTKKSDVYNYGMVCYEIVTGFLPFEREGFVGSKAEQELVINGQRPSFPHDTDCRLKDLIRRCWHEDENQRPRFNEIVNKIWEYCRS